MAVPATALTRQARQPLTTVDLEQFSPAVDAALNAFGRDATYGVLIARSAVTIKRKRQIGAARRRTAG